MESSNLCKIRNLYRAIAEMEMQLERHSTEHKRSHAALPAQRAERIALWRDCRRTAPVALKHVEGDSGNGKGWFRQTAQRQGGQPPTVFQADERRRENAGGHTLLRRLHTGNNKNAIKEQ